MATRTALVDLLVTMSEATRRLNEAKLAALRPGAAPPAKVPGPEPKAGLASVPARAKAGNKFSALTTEGPAPWGGTMPYPSKVHAAYARRLAAEKAAGLIRSWAPEVSYIVGRGPRGYRRHRVDFEVIAVDGRQRLVEVKGHDHADGKSRRADLEAMGFEVTVVR